MSFEQVTPTWIAFKILTIFFSLITEQVINGQLSLQLDRLDGLPIYNTQL